MTTTTDTSPGTAAAAPDPRVNLRQSLDLMAQAWHGIQNFVEPVLAAAETADPVVADIAALEPETRAMVAEFVSWLRHRTPAAATPAAGAPEPAGTGG
jgi:hypothetical protein